MREREFRFVSFRRIVLSCLLFILAFSPASSYAADAMYVWGYTTALIEDTTDTKLQELISFCRTYHIDRLLLEYDDDHDEARWHHVLDQLHNTGISAEAVVGHVSWIFEGTADSVNGLRLMDDLLAFQSAAASPDEAFDAVHFDIELNALERPLRLSYAPGVLATKYLALVDELLQKRTDNGFDADSLPYVWAMGGNYDNALNAGTVGVYYDVYEEMLVEKELWKHIFDRLDNIVFMAYNDRVRYVADGLFDEIEYLKTMSVRPVDPQTYTRTVSFAFEAQERNNDGSSLFDESICNENFVTYVNLRQTVDVLRHYLVSDGGWSYGPFVIHCYDNKLPTGKDYRDYVETHTSWYPDSIPFEQVGDTLTVPTDGITEIDHPVWLEIELVADALHAVSSAYEGDITSRTKLMFVPFGKGYASHARYIENAPQYDGLIPIPWYFIMSESLKDYLNWLPGKTWTELDEGGIVWANPANTNEPQRGVVRRVKMEEGEYYKFSFCYVPASGIQSELTVKSLRAPYAESGWGDSPETAIPMQMFLGTVSNYSVIEASHVNSSLCIVDVDRDGLSDNKEVVYGTDPELADTDGDGVNDGDEVAMYDDPLIYNDRVDSDGDGLSGTQEAIFNTDPDDPDTDNDGVFDLIEIYLGTNPNDGESGSAAYQVWNATRFTPRDDLPIFISGGTVWASGPNAGDMLCVGQAGYITDPLPVLGLPANIVMIDGAENAFCALDADGYIWQWGLDTNDVRYTPARKARPVSFTAIQAYNYHCNFALDIWGRVWKWSMSSPYSYMLIPGMQNIAAFKYEFDMGVAIDEYGDVWVWSDVPGMTYFGGQSLGTPIEIDISDYILDVQIEPDKMCACTWDAAWEWGYQNAPWEVPTPRRIMSDEEPWEEPVIVVEPDPDDLDHDGISNDDELLLGTSPYSTDTDGDGVPDDIEIMIGEDPIVASRPYAGPDWYVDIDSSEVPACGNETRPFRSIQDAVDAIEDLVDRDEAHTIWIAPGFYHESVSIHTSELSLIGRGDDPEDVIIDAAGLPEQIVDIYIDGSQYICERVGIATHAATAITIENLTVQNANGGSGIRLGSGAFHTIRDVTVRGCAKGVRADRCHLFGDWFGPSGVLITGGLITENEQGVMLNCGTCNVTVEDNYFEHNQVYGVRLVCLARCVSIRDNLMDYNGFSIRIHYDSGEASVVEGNAIYGGYWGLYVDADSSVGRVSYNDFGGQWNGFLRHYGTFSDDLLSLEERTKAHYNWYGTTSYAEIVARMQGLENSDWEYILDGPITQ